MGASNSIHTKFQQIYIISDSTDETLVERLHAVRARLNDVTNERQKYVFTSRQKMDDPTADNIEQLMKTAVCIAVCVSQKTVDRNNYIEMGLIHRFRDKLLFIIAKPFFSPSTNPNTKILVGNQRWKTLYNQDDEADNLATDIYLHYY